LKNEFRKNYRKSKKCTETENYQVPFKCLELENVKCKCWNSTIAYYERWYGAVVLKLGGAPTSVARKVRKGARVCSSDMVLENRI